MAIMRTTALLLLSVLLVAPMVPAGAAPVSALCFGRVRTASPLVALTFDCCQNKKPAGYDAAIINLLVKNQVPATFFLGGRWIEAHPQPAKYMATIPFFELENHSYLHPHMTKISLDEVRQELTKQGCGHSGVQECRGFM